MRAAVISVLVGVVVSAVVGWVLSPTVVGWVQEPLAQVVPRCVPDGGFAVIADLAGLGILAVPGMVVGIVLYAHLGEPGGGRTRCRKCGYTLRGLTEPRCPECGERI